MFNFYKSLIGSFMTTSSLITMDDIELPCTDSVLSISSVLLSSLLLSKDNNLNSKVENTSLLIESMSLEELYELKDLIDEKSQVYKL